MMRCLSALAIPLVGSSRRIRRGRSVIALAMSTNFFSPWDNVEHSVFSRGVRPNASTMPSISARSAGNQEAGRNMLKVLPRRANAPTSIISATVKVGKTLTSWKERANPRRVRAAGSSARTYHYKSRRPDQASLEIRIREICQTRIRYGYRRVHVLLRREGWQLGQNKTRRIYRQLGLQLRNKTPKRRVKAKLRNDRTAATQPNETWAMDFVHDQLATGSKIRVLTVVDLFSRYVPVLDPRFSYRAENVVQTLQTICLRLAAEGRPEVQPERSDERPPAPGVLGERVFHSRAFPGLSRWAATTNR
jgi:transposase InsO family protein